MRAGGRGRQRRTHAHRYTTEGGRLDRDKWLAASASYTTNVFAQLQGETNYRVQGRADFVVLMDLEKERGEAGKFLLLIWQDLGTSSSLLSKESSWQNLKELYR